MSTATCPAAVDDVADPRLDDYRDLKDQRLDANSGRFVAESEMVVRKLLASRLEVLSVLVTEPRWRSLSAAPPPERPRPDTPVYLVPQGLMDRVAGFHVHRGCLAIGKRPTAVSIPQDARLVVALEDLVDVDNVGAIVRNASAFGADALLLSPRAADPYYRKAIRVAMGNTFALPIVRSRSWPDTLTALRQQSFTIVGTVLSPTATPLPRFSAPARSVLLFGSEGPGLSQDAQAACDHLVTIPMVSADSLNVATACAIFLYHFAHR